MKKFLILVSLNLLISGNSETNIPVNNEEQEPKREYTKKIERIATNDFENNLILSAESIYPIRDSVIAYAPDFLLDDIPENNCWFYGVFDSVLIPFAIASDGITYYSDLINTMLAGNKYQFIFKAAFEYRAEISFKETYTFEGKNLLTEKPLTSVSFNRVYVVTMKLNWDHYCGPECGLYISHQRVVVFDEAGNLLNVFYDGPIPISVS